MALRAGARIDHYKVLQHLGAGTFGDVYKVQDTTDGSVLAVKVLKSPDPTVERELTKEARALVAVVHPHVVRFRGLHPMRDGTFALLMDFAQGEDLQTFFRRNRDLPTLLGLIHQVAGGLDAAHQRGVTHRDVKPENVLVQLVQDRPWALISDFGLGREEGYALRSRLAHAAGTMPYLSPEVVSEGKTDGGDIDRWALAVMAFYLLSGDFPFPFTQRGYPDFSSPRTFTDLFERAPQGLDYVFGRAFSTDMQRRYSMSVEFTTALAGALGLNVTTLVPPPGPGPGPIQIIEQVLDDLPKIPKDLPSVGDPNTQYVQARLLKEMRKVLTSSHRGALLASSMELSFRRREGILTVGMQRRAPRVRKVALGPPDPSVLKSLGFSAPDAARAGWTLRVPVEHNKEDIAERLALGLVDGFGVPASELAGAL